MAKVKKQEGKDLEAEPSSVHDQIERWPMERIVPYDRNPRLNDSAVIHVLESLKKHGQVRPVIVSAPGHPFENPVLCCGHTTLKALRDFGAKEVLVQVHAFDSEAEFVDYNIRDNKTTEFASWDESELAKLSEEFTIDLSSMGFSFGKMDDSIPDENKPIDEDEMAKTENECPKCGFKW